MATSLPSDEVAGDYKEALEDLITNDRFQIANLTMVAKENIEHAEAIARVLTLHIKKAPPGRKLPALYVLDSLVKNIGSPYTVYFDRNLHETYMLAYSQVDQTVRKKLEEMLKTWREPVPGSLSNVPVFPLPSTQSILDALNRYKQSTAGRAQQYPPQLQMRPTSVVQTNMPYRQTPTPPLSDRPSAPSISVQQPTPIPQPQHLPFYQATTSLPQIPTHLAIAQPWQTSGPSSSSMPASLSTAPFLHQNGQSNNRNGIDLTKLHTDIDDLTLDAKIFCTTHPLDQVATKKLQTLQTLKEILDSGSASNQDLQDIRNSIDQQLAKKAAEKQVDVHAAQPHSQSLYQDASRWQHNNLYPQSQYPQQQYLQTQYQQMASTPMPVINSNNLAELLRNTQSSVQAPSVQLYGQDLTVIAATGTPAVPDTTTVSTLKFLEQLRASGLLSNSATPNQGTTPPTAFAQLNIDEVSLTSAAFKIPRPHLIMRFLNEKPNQCSTCGRRFTSDDAGKAKKEKHLDWHFKTKTRGIEAEQRGQNRSWYVDELDWINTVEQLDDLGLEDAKTGPNGSSPNGTVKKQQEDIVRAPSDPNVRSLPCPIDQEPFKSEWSADIQDFIWRDALRVGDRYYHASCYREMMKGREIIDKTSGGRSTPLSTLGHKRTSTPDSVLGKRKAEDNEPASASKLRMKLEA